MKMLILAGLSALVLAAQPAPTANSTDVNTYLGLSDTQANSLKGIRDQAKKDLQPLRETMRQKADALRQATKSGSTDAAAIGQLTIDLRNARQQITPIRTRAHDQAMSVLTPNQKAKLAQLETGPNNGKADRKVFRQAARLGLLTPGTLAERLKGRARAARGRRL